MEVQNAVNLPLEHGRVLVRNARGYSRKVCSFSRAARSAARSLIHISVDNCISQNARVLPLRYCVCMVDQKTILVVEDNEGYRMLLSDALTDAGFAVLLAKSGEEALEKVKESPDLILLDHMLPGLSGVEVLKTIRGRGDAWSQAVPVYMLTQKDDLNTVANAMEAGISGYLVKSGEELSRIVDTVRQKLAQTEAGHRKGTDL